MSPATSPTDRPGHGGRRILLAVCVLPLAAAAADMATVAVGDQTFTVEIARTAEQRQRGLSNRPPLAERSGMLFVMPETGVVSFWMHQVGQPLDLLYFDADGLLHEIHPALPPCPASGDCPLYTSQHPVAYVLELPADSARRFKLQPGLRLQWQ